MKIDMQVTGLDKLRAQFAQFSDRRFDASIATALTRTARIVEQSWQQQLSTRFDKPTPATQRATFVQQATAATLASTLKIKDQATGTPPVQWLAPEELGGQRGMKKFERALQAQGSMPSGWRAVPGPSAKLDGYGNVARSQIVQVIAQLGAQFSPGYARVISASAAKRSAKAVASGRAYIAITTRSGRLSPGVYERKGKGLAAVFYFVPATQYRRRLELVTSAQQQAPAILQEQIGRALAESMTRLQARASQ